MTANKHDLPKARARERVWYTILFIFQLRITKSFFKIPYQSFSELCKGFTQQHVRMSHVSAFFVFVSRKSPNLYFIWTFGYCIKLTTFHVIKTLQKFIIIPFTDCYQIYCQKKKLEKKKLLLHFNDRLAHFNVIEDGMKYEGIKSTSHILLKTIIANSSEINR